MKTRSPLKGILAVLTFVLMAGTLSAQTSQEQIHQKKVDAQTASDYDTWKQNQTATPAVESNVLLSTTANDNATTSHVVQLGTPFENAEAARTYEQKLAQQAGVIKVEANAANNTVMLLIKTEVAARSLSDFFDIK